jgi:hypothetical protein
MVSDYLQNSPSPVVEQKESKAIALIWVVDGNRNQEQT